MNYLYIFLISLANNLDNIGVRIAYSILGIRIGVTQNLWISIITFVIALLSAYGGNTIYNLLSKSTSSIISAVLLSCIGLWIIFSPRIKREHTASPNEKNIISDILDNPEKADLDCSKDIDFKEATLLGLVCSLDCVGSGFGAGMMGLKPVYFGLFSSVISFLALWAGNYITDFIQKWQLSNKATTIAGVALILMGIQQIIFL